MKDTQNSLGHCHMLLGGPTLQEQPQEQVQHSNISEEQPQLPPVAKKHFVLFVVLIFKGLSNFGHIRRGVSWHVQDFYILLHLVLFHFMVFAICISS